VKLESLARPVAVELAVWIEFAGAAGGVPPPLALGFCTEPAPEPWLIWGNAQIGNKKTAVMAAMKIFIYLRWVWCIVRSLEVQ
jgi:hypothetical protein